MRYLLVRISFVLQRVWIESAFYSASTMLGLLGFTCAPQATHGNRSRTNTTDERNRHRRVFEKPINQDLEEQQRHGTAVALAPGFHRLRQPNASAMRRWNARIRVFLRGIFTSLRGTSEPYHTAKAANHRLQ